jgi:hypothetical protein
MKPLSLAKRVHRKLVRAWTTGRCQTSKALAKTYFALPWMAAASNPRNRVKEIPECSQCMESLDQLLTAEAGKGADGYVVLVENEIYHRHLPALAGPGDEDRLGSAAGQYQGGCTFQAPAVFLARLHHARIVSHEGLVLDQQGDILLESAMSREEVLQQNGIFERLVPPRGIPRPGRYALLAHPWSYGYYHWLLEALPRLALLEQDARLADLQLIVPGPLKRFQQETLQLAGIPDERLVSFDGGCWEVEELFFPSLPAPTGNPSPHAVEWLRRTFLPGTPDLAEPSGLGGRKLYLSRRDAPQRRLLNETQITDFLVSEGFEIYCAGDHSFAEQVKTFSEASLVIAPHGAAVSNMVFASSSACLIEFFGRNYVNGCYWALANLRQQPYGCLTGEPTGLDYTISLAALQSMMAGAGLSGPGYPPQF